MNAELKEMLGRIANWPREDQEELAQIALEIEARRAAPYQATPAELKAVDEGLAAVERGEIATDREVEAVLARYRRV
jgi:predicted transcriptional regulator